MPVSIPIPANRAPISYGNVQFDAATETTAFDFKVVPTEDGRWVKHVEVSITLRAYVTTSTDPNDTTDAQMNQLRQTLQTPGLEFIYTSGAGSFHVNGNSPKKDINFGPKPQLLRFKSLGNSKAAKIYWSVLVTLAECPHDVYIGIKEFNHKLAWTITRGLTRRTITGFVEIMNGFTAPGQRITRDCADAYRNVVSTIPIPNGFHRLNPQTYNLSGNRSRLDFTLIDESLPNYNVPPPGTLSAKFSHAVQTSSLYGPALLAGTMTGEYRMPRNVSAQVAYYYFWRAVLFRLRSTAANQIAGQVAGVKPAIILRGFRMEEADSYSDQVARFSLSYSFTATLSTLLSCSALWTPMPDSDYRLWVAQLGPVFGPRGFDGLGFGRGEAVISLCDQGNPATNPPGGATGGQTNPAGTGPGGLPAPPGTQTTYSSGGGNPNPQNYTPRPPRGGTINFPGGWRIPGFGLQLGWPNLPPLPPPDPTSSWLYFENEIFIEQIDSTVEIKPLPKQPIDPLVLAAQQAPTAAPAPAGPKPPLGPSTAVAPEPPVWIVGTSPSTSPGVLGNQALGVVGAGTSGGSDTTVGPVEAYDDLPDDQAPDPQAEVRASPTVYVWMTGRALRVNFTVSPPTLLKVGGVKVVPANIEGCGFGQQVAGLLGGYPVVGCRWRFRYLALGVPSGVGVPSTPLG